ncbi:MAG: Lpg1974 family pore-forming outer membrane protein [Chlamydiales bacterium]
MRYIFFPIFYFLILSTAHATTKPIPGSFGLEYEFLWLYPSLGKSYFVIDADPGASETNIVGSRIDNPTRGYPVFRLDGFYTFCDCPNLLRLRGTYFYRNRSMFKKVTGSNLFPTIGIPGGGNNEPENYAGEASSTIKVDYFNVEGFFGHYLCDWSPFFLSLNVGVEFARLDICEQVDYEPTDGDNDLFVTSRDHYWGWGPEFLIDASYDLCCWPCKSCDEGGYLSLRGEFRGSLLYGKNRAILRSFSTTTTENIDLKNDAQLKIVPAWGGRLSLNYSKCFCSLLCNVEVGYQAIFYEAPTDVIRVLNAPIQGGTEDFDNQFGFIGPFIGVGINF